MRYIDAGESTVIVILLVTIGSLKVLTVLKIDAMRLLGYSKHLEMFKEDQRWKFCSRAVFYMDGIDVWVKKM